MMASYSSLTVNVLDFSPFAATENPPWSATLKTLDPSTEKSSLIPPKVSLTG